LFLPVRFALQNANWLEAKKQFDKALTESDAREARDGLGLALWWLSESLWHGHVVSATNANVV
jgi:hypothetical protein